MKMQWRHGNPSARKAAKREERQHEQAEYMLKPAGSTSSAGLIRADSPDHLISSIYMLISTSSYK